MNKKKKWLILGIVEAAAVLLIIGYCVLCHNVENETIWGNTTINGVAMKGLTLEEADQAVREQFETEYQDAAVTVALGDQEYSIPVYDVLTMDPSEEIQEAYKLGHGAWFARGAEWIRSQMGLAGAGDLEALPTVSYPEKLDEAIAASGIQSYNSVSESTYEVSGNNLIIHKGNKGEVADVEQLKTAILDALEAGDYTETIQCPTAESQTAAMDFQAVAAAVAKAPVNATLDPANNYAVVPAVSGLALDTAQAQAAYDSAPEGTDVTVPLTETPAEISTEDLQANLFKDVLGSYQSTAGGNGGREHNIALAVSMCNGTVVMPGEIFSYNGHHRQHHRGKRLRNGQRVFQRSSCPGTRRRSLPGVLHPFFPRCCIRTLRSSREDIIP